MEDVTITSTLVSGYRYALNFFTYLPKVIKGQKGNGFTVSSNPVLMLIYKPPKGVQVNFKESYYKITPKNLYRTIKFFNRVVSWFYDKELQDLYLNGENNELIFNADYNRLKVVTDYDPNNLTAMKAIPAVISYDNGKEYEGIYLYINKTDYVIPLPLFEIEALLGILSHFSFEAKMNELINSFMIALQTQSIQELPQNGFSYGGNSSNGISNQDQWS